MLVCTCLWISCSQSLKGKFSKLGDNKGANNGKDPIAGRHGDVREEGHSCGSHFPEKEEDPGHKAGAVTGKGQAHFPHSNSNKGGVSVYRCW